MPVEVAQAILNITPSMRGLQALIDREMRGVDSRRAGQQAGEGYSSGFGASAKKLTGILGAAFAAVKIGDFAKSAVDQASDLNEVATKMQVVFGDANGAVQEFASQGAKALGLSSLEAQNAAANFGVFGKSAGLAGKDQADFSTGMAKLAVDMASFSNTTPEDAIEALSSGLRGEAEPLRKYGVLLDDASLRNEALSMGLITTTKDALTPQQKVLASHALIMKQTADAQGDFARTSGGLANQQRILSAQWTDMKGKIGQAFLPAVTATVTALNDHLFPVLDGLGTKAKDAWGVLSTGEFTAGSSLGEEDSPLVDKLFKAHELFEKVGPALRGAWDILAHGDFTGGLGVEEDSPLVDLMFKIREFGLDTFDRLGKIWDTLRSTAVELWDPIKQIASSLFDAFQTVSGTGLSAWDLLLDAFQGIADLLKATLVPLFTWIANFMRDNPAVVLTLVGALVAWKTATMAIAVASNIAKIAVAAFNVVMDANPVTLVVIALAALAAGLVWAYTNVGWFKDAVDAAWSFIKDATTALWEGALKPAINWVADNIHVVGDFFIAMWNAAQPVFDFLKSSFENFLHLIQGVIDFIVGVFTGDWSRAWEGIKQIAGAIWDQIVAYVSLAWDLITGIGGKILEWLGAFAGWAWDRIVAIANQVVQWGVEFLTWLWTGIKNKAVEVFQWFSELPGAVWSRVLALVGTITQYGIDFILWIKDGIVTGASAVWNWFTQLPSEIGKIIDGMIEKIKAFGGKIAGWIGDGIRSAAKAVADAVTSLFDLKLNAEGTGFDTTGVGVVTGGTSRGGVIPGRDPGRRDNVLARLASGGLWGLRSREAVMVPEFTDAVGVSGVHALNRAAEQGQLSNYMPGFARGGVVDEAKQIGIDAAGGLAKGIKAGTQGGLFGDAVKAFTDKFKASAAVNLSQFTTSQDPSSFGWQRAAGIVPFSFAGLGTSVAGGTPGLWSALLSALAPSIPGGVRTLGGFENRNNVNNPGVPSFHAYGLAMDVNAPWNPNGVSGYGRSGQYVIPSGPAHSLAARYGMLWGGDFSGTPDPMHFEIHLPPSAIGGAIAGTLGVASGLAGYNPTAGVAQWHSTVLKALGLTGQPAAYASYVEHQMQTESSGNPRAINLTDVNAQRGDPSRGLMQVIMSTFQRYRLPQLSADIYEPLANIVAAIRYVLARYGSIPAGMRGVAYDTGGWLMPGMTGRNLGPRPEAVLNPAQSDALITHARNLEAGFAGQGPVILNINLDNSDPLQVAVAGMIRAGIDQDRIDMTFVAREMAGQSV